MRSIVTSALGAVLLVGFATTVAAKKPAKKSTHAAARQASHPAPAPAEGNAWYARDASKLPFGSNLWWDQMLRENRLTCCN